MKVWEKAVKMLDIAGYQYTIIITERRNHARDVIWEMDPTELFYYAGIVSISGDGLPHEIINALATRPDSEEALKIGVAPLPGGSANAIVKNIAATSGEPCNVEGAAFQIIKN